MTDSPNCFRILLRLLLASMLLFALACAQESSDSGDSSGGGGDTSSGGSSNNGGGSSAGNGEDNGPGIAFASLCGAVIDGTLFNPIASADLEPVTVEVLQPDTVIIRRTAGIDAGNAQLVKLHGVSRSGVQQNFLLQAGIDLIRQLTASGAFFVRAGNVIDSLGVGTPCELSFDGGGLGTAGQLFSPAGENVNEALLREGAVLPRTDACGSELLQTCYQSIQPNEQFSTQTIRNFLWKPVSERDGNLVVLVDPVGITVIVNGEPLPDFGPSNGRGTTARANRPGGAFGGNITVTFVDSQGRTVVLSNGERSVNIPNGAQRVEFIL